MTVSLVRGYSNLAHRSSCYSVKGKKVRGIAPEIEEADVPAFLKARATPDTADPDSAQ